MKKYTFKLLIVTVITGLGGLPQLNYFGVNMVRFLFLVSFIGLFLSCLDAVIVSRKKRRALAAAKDKEAQRVKVNQ